MYHFVLCLSFVLVVVQSARGQTVPARSASILLTVRDIGPNTPSKPIFVIGVYRSVRGSRIFNSVEAKRHGVGRYERGFRVATR